jgi:hypothetical protein
METFSVILLLTKREDVPVILLLLTERGDAPVILPPAEGEKSLICRVLPLLPAV